mmetsp:Transcript_6855/g.7884  ORF Transcript_6855/g.7884 Transcript_6855/m.7884 type:complete len:89 (-) Transcript_6855:769-1035(-)
MTPSFAIHKKCTFRFIDSWVGNFHLQSKTWFMPILLRTYSLENHFEGHISQGEDYTFNSIKVLCVQAFGRGCALQGTQLKASTLLVQM